MLPHPTISTKLLTSWFLTRQKHPIKGKGGVRTSTSPEIWHRGIEDTTILHRFMELFRQLQRRRRVAALRRAAAALPYIAGYQTYLISYFYLFAAKLMYFCYPRQSMSRSPCVATQLFLL